MKKLLLFAVITLIAACAAQKYTAPDFERLTRNHDMVAVVPVEMVFTGRQPEDLSPYDIQKLEEAESQAFQISLHNALLNKAEKKTIYFQEIDKTNQLLEESGYTIRQSWDIRGEQLAEILGVDAVVKMRIEKQRYLSDLESFGIDLAQGIVNILSGWRFSPWIGDEDLNKTNDIRAKATLINQKDGKVLWNYAIDREADWNNPPADIINNVTRRMARNFPYDKK